MSGCKDQIMTAFGGLNLVEFRTEKDISVRRVQLSPQRLAELEQYLFLVFTGIKRKASEVVAKQLERVDQNLELLRSMRSMAYEGHDILTGHRSMREFGELLHLAWMAKRGVWMAASNPGSDETYERGLKSGAWGGKLLGAGGGGFMLSLLHLDSPREAESASLTSKSSKSD